MSTSSLQIRGVSLGMFKTCSLYLNAYIHAYIHSTAFNDFGPKFTCVDPTGEQPLSGMIVSIDKVTLTATFSDALAGSFV